ncbi:MAG: hypothetical protein EP318_07740 [Rhodobacteraceae bacterium]|nr:MAG: hypothetical protein EP318_07740 [Paracoccaceae bacterium]
MRGSLLCNLVLCLGLLAGTASAQRQPDHDPSHIPFDLRAKRLDACNLSIGADPSWSFTRTPYRGQDGPTGAKYKAVLDTEFWVRHLGLQSRLTAAPYAAVSVTCAPTKTKEGDKYGLGFYAGGFHKAWKKRKDTTVGALRHYTAPGLGTVWYFVSQRKGSGKRRGAVTDEVYLMALHRGQLVNATVTLFRTPPSRFRKPHPAGREQRITLTTGEVIWGRLTTATLEDPRSGALYGLRSAPQNMALIERFMKMFRGL